MTKPKPRPTFASNLRAARLKAKLTQEALARRLGFKRMTPISLWERDENHLPQPETVIKLATALGCPPAALLRGVVTPYDVLRAAHVRVPRDPEALSQLIRGAPDLTPLEQRLLKLARLLPQAVLLRHMTLIEEHLRHAGVLDGRSAPDARYRAAPRRKPAAPTPAAATPTP